MKAMFSPAMFNKDPLHRSYMGFRPGKVYSIRTECQTVRCGSGIKACLCVYDNDSENWCPYESLESFLKNWKLI